MPIRRTNIGESPPCSIAAFVRTASLWSTISACTASCHRRTCCCKSIPVSGSIGHTMASSGRCDRIQDGAPMALRFMRGTARSYVSLSRWIPAIEKSWPGHARTTVRRDEDRNDRACLGGRHQCATAAQKVVQRGLISLREAA